MTAAREETEANDPTKASSEALPSPATCGTSDYALALHHYWTSPRSTDWHEIFHMEEHKSSSVRCWNDNTPTATLHLQPCFHILHTPRQAALTSGTDSIPPPARKKKYVKEKDGKTEICLTLQSAIKSLARVIERADIANIQHFCKAKHHLQNILLQEATGECERVPDRRAQSPGSCLALLHSRLFPRSRGHTAWGFARPHWAVNGANG